MKKYSFHRGHKIEEIDGAFYFADTGESVPDTWRNRPCGKCGEFNTPEGHDACLGVIPGPVMNACCGHGNNRCAYIQFNDGTSIRGDAVFEHVHNIQLSIEDEKMITKEQKRKLPKAKFFRVKELF